MEIEEDGPVYGSGNIYADMGVPNPELANAKASLAIEIIRVIRARKLTQAQAAEIMDIKQPRVSKIVRGRLSEISFEALMDYLQKLGSTVEFTVTSPAPTLEGSSRSRTFEYGGQSSSRSSLHAIAEELEPYETADDKVALGTLAG